MTIRNHYWNVLTAFIGLELVAMTSTVNAENEHSCSAEMLLGLRESAQRYHSTGNNAECFVDSKGRRGPDEDEFFGGCKIIAGEGEEETQQVDNLRACLQRGVKPRALRINRDTFPDGKETHPVTQASEATLHHEDVGVKTWTGRGSQTRQFLQFCFFGTNDTRTAIKSKMLGKHVQECLDRYPQTKTGLTGDL